MPWEVLFNCNLLFFMYIITRYEYEISLRHFQAQAVAMATADKDSTRPAPDRWALIGTDN
jgi:hypothetical protein